MLTIYDYDYQEKKNRAFLSNRFLRAFRAGLFENGGFPTIIYDECEIVRYIDSQHAESFQNYFCYLCEGLSQDEFDVAVYMAKTLYQYTFKTFNCEFLVKSPILDAIYCWRLIRSLTGTDTAIRIMEAGAGSGMLGGILLQQGYSYIGTDVTQAFYLTANRVLSLFTNNLCELALDQSVYDYEAQCIHIPYWKLWEERDKEGGVDVFTCNHALLEMHENAVRFYLKIAAQRMHNSKYGFFVVRGFGWNIQHSIQELMKEFESFGYKLQYFDFNHETVVYSLQGNSVYEQAIQLLKDPHYTQKEEYQIYSLGKNTKAKLNDRALFTGDLGKQIYNFLTHTESRIGIEALERAYGQITSVQDSPDEVFGKFVRSTL